MWILLLLAFSVVVFFIVRWCLRHGVWIPFGKGIWIRRWYAPVKESDDTLLALQKSMQD
eukprot:gene6604-9414_t